MVDMMRQKCKVCKENFGAENRGWLCSVCFKNKENQDQLDKVLNESKKQDESKIVDDPNFPVQTNLMNCWKCDKKVGHLGFKCDCSYIYCKAHRHFSDHECPFDIKLKKNILKPEQVNQSQTIK